MFEKELAVYRRLSTNKSEIISDSCYTLLSLYLDSYTKYTQEITVQSFLNWLSEYPVKQNSKRTIAHTLGKFFVTFEHLTAEQFNILKKSFKAKPLDWSNKVIPDDMLIEFFMALEANSNNEFALYRDMTAFLALLVTGVRISQLLELQTKDIKLTDESIAMSFTTKKQNEINLEYNATDAKVIPNNSGFLQYNFRNYLKKYLFLRKYYANSDYVFVNAWGAGLSNQHYRNLCHVCAPDSNITPHSFRHTAISRVANKHGLFKANVLAGHKNINTTKVYIKPKQEDIADAYIQSNTKWDIGQDGQWD